MLVLSQLFYMVSNLGNSKRTTYASIVRQQKRLLAHHDFQRIPLEKHKL